MSPRSEPFRPVDPARLGVVSHHAPIDPKVPSPARIYDYWLGGKDNFEADRVAAEKFIDLNPAVRDLAQQNRAFMRRAAAHLAEAGIEQFLDLGTGIPTSPNVHEVVRETRPDARVAYVDNDPIVLAHNRALRETPGVVAIEADIRDPDRVLADPALTALIDLDRPVGLLGVAVMHFVAEDETVAGFVRRLVPGSHVVLSVASSIGMSPEHRRKVEDAYDSSAAIKLRSREEIAGLFAGLDLLEPGVVPMTAWRPAPEGDRRELSPVVLAGVARVP